MPQIGIIIRMDINCHQFSFEIGINDYVRKILQIAKSQKSGWGGGTADRGCRRHRQRRIWLAALLPSGNIQHQGDFVAIGELGAVQAIRPHFLRKHVLINQAKAQMLEKVHFVGQGK